MAGDRWWAQRRQLDPRPLEQIAGGATLARARRAPLLAVAASRHAIRLQHCTALCYNVWPPLLPPPRHRTTVPAHRAGSVCGAQASAAAAPPARAIRTSAPSRATAAASRILVATPPVVSCAAALVSRLATAAPSCVNATAPHGRPLVPAGCSAALAASAAALTSSRAMSCAPGSSGGRVKMPSTLVCRGQGVLGVSSWEEAGRISSWRASRAAKTTSLPHPPGRPPRAGGSARTAA